MLPDTGSRTLGLMLTELDLPLGENPARVACGSASATAAAAVCPSGVGGASRPRTASLHH